MSRKIKFILGIALILASLVAVLSRPTSHSLAAPGQGAIILRQDASGWGILFDDEGKYLYVSGFDPQVDCTYKTLINQGGLQLTIIPQPGDVQRYLAGYKSNDEHVWIFDATGYPTGDWESYFCGFVTSRDPLYTGVVNAVVLDSDFLLTGNNNAKSFGGVLNGDVVDQSTGETHHFLLTVRVVSDPSTGSVMHQSVKIKIN